MSRITINKPGIFNLGDTVRIISKEEYVGLGCPTSRFPNVYLYSEESLEPIFGKEVYIGCIRVGYSFSVGGYVFYMIREEGKTENNCITIDDLVIEYLTKDSTYSSGFKIGDIVQLQGLKDDISKYNGYLGQISSIFEDKESEEDPMIYMVEVEIPGMLDTPRPIASNIPMVICKSEGMKKWEDKMSFDGGEEKIHNRRLGRDRCTRSPETREERKNY